MEPADVNPGARDDARLEALLRRPAPPLADDGFSARVLAALPPVRAAAAGSAKIVRRHERAEWLGVWVGVVVALLGCFFWPTSPAESAGAFFRAVSNATYLADPALALAVLVAAGSILYAFWPRLRPLFPRP